MPWGMQWPPGVSPVGSTSAWYSASFARASGVKGAVSSKLPTPLSAAPARPCGSIVQMPERSGTGGVALPQAASTRGMAIASRHWRNIITSRCGTGGSAAILPGQCRGVIENPAGPAYPLARYAQSRNCTTRTLEKQGMTGETNANSDASFQLHQAHQG